MEYLRTTVNSNALASIFDLPASLRDRSVEVIILPADGELGERPLRRSSKGCLKKYANPKLVTWEEGAWGNAAEAKYADR